LPLWPKNATAMGRQIIQASQKYLGNSVMIYELGNEVCIHAFSSSCPFCVQLFLSPACSCCYLARACAPSQNDPSAAAVTCCTCCCSLSSGPLGLAAMMPRASGSPVLMHTQSGLMWWLARSTPATTGKTRSSCLDLAGVSG
jgi:hypothetical protein